MLRSGAIVLSLSLMLSVAVVGGNANYKTNEIKKSDEVVISETNSNKEELRKNEREKVKDVVSKAKTNDLEREIDELSNYNDKVITSESNEENKVNLNKEELRENEVTNVIKNTTKNTDGDVSKVKTDKIKREEFFVLDYNDELVDGYELFGDRVNSLESLRSKYEYVSDYDLLLNDGYGDLLVEINNFYKERYTIIDYDGYEIKGKERAERYGEYVFYILDTYKDTYEHLTNYEILETYILGEDYMKEINYKNMFLFSIYDYEGKLVNSFEVYDEDEIVKSRALKADFPYVSNYDIIENMWLGLEDINEFAKENFQVIDETGKEIDGFRLYGEKTMSFLANNKNDYENLTNYEIVSNFYNGVDLEKLNKEKGQRVDK